MARSEWQQLLSHSGVRNTSISDIARQMETSTSPALTSAGNLSGIASGGAGSSTALQQSSSNEMAQQMSSLVSQITGLNSTQQAAITAIQGNTQAVTQNTSTKGSGSSVASQAGGIAESLFGGALSLSPILSGIMSLFIRGQRRSSGTDVALHAAGTRSIPGWPGGIFRWIGDAGEPRGGRPAAGADDHTGTAGHSPGERDG